MDLFVHEEIVEPLWEESLKGGLKYGGGENLSLSDYFNIRLVLDPPQGYHRGYQIRRGDSSSIDLIKTNHVQGMKSYAVGLGERGEWKVFYTSDTVFDKDLIAFATSNRYERIFHDCQLYTGGVHASLEELLEGIPETVQRRIMLMHYGDDMEDFIGNTGDMQFARQGCTYLL